jgi:hypothetical protein
MRTLLLFVFLCGNLYFCEAQQNYFVYLQTDNKQPFYVKVNEKVFSSSSSGYVVVPKLQNGNHVFSIGFPKNEWPQQVIPVTITGKDQGYILKNFESKGWGLFNMQTLDVVMSNSSTPASSQPSGTTTRTDQFSNTLADVVNTPSIKEISKEENKQKEVPKPAEPVKAVTDQVKSEPAPATSVVTPVEAAPQNPAPPKTLVPANTSSAVVNNGSVPGRITKMSESSTGEAVVIKYLVQDEGSPQADTVQVMITIPSAVPPAEMTVQDPAPVKSSPAVNSAAKPAIPADPNAPKFIDIELANPNSAKDSSENKGAEPQTVTDSAEKAPANVPAQPASAAVKVPATELKMINSDCKSTAGEPDFIRIRKKMIAQKSEDEMINAAEKLFRQKCYSTEQVKNLSVLLLKQESKYKFFDLAYAFVYDSSNFRELESQLTDPYFLSRFRAMIRK